ncbi:MAG: acyl-CoA reductase [Candidatus Pedobacter colombiensis]|uniref:Acyl-CoA reductase n=1 Tax=Candidatus Pedobacter colombiensis TaxID=3121371 RepID=A0AAJ5W573_9SPHI|nr:acyl-CoA reductase [Pedobacter sp.]WEK18321.1 MAG: acyl-CoA reductase [Pedobacter sp.]
MPILNSEKLIIAFKKLSDFIVEPGEAFKNLILSASNNNAWFTVAEVQKALHALHQMLNQQDLETWFKSIRVSDTPKKVGLILAGNIPLVGFHDVISVLATGNIALIKLSSADDKLLPALLTELIKIEPLLADHIVYVDRLKDFDAVIATGSNNTSRYFDYYFGKGPNIIRKNRNSVAVITGNERKEELALLGHDIFDYFGLGCRNVSKLYIPEDYDIKNFFEPIGNFKDIINHFKYNNNYDYNKSIYLVNLKHHYDNGFLLLTEDESLSSPLAVLYYETYTNLEQLEELLRNKAEDIQCIVSNAPLKLDTAILAFGQSQRPKLWDYADNVNTIDFLNSL